MKRDSILTLDRSWRDAILLLYRSSDDDFILPLSQRKINAENMMNGVFQSGEYLGMVSDGALVACGGYRLLGEGRAEIHGIVVHTAHRGRGLGKILLNAIIERETERGVQFVDAGT